MRGKPLPRTLAWLLVLALGLSAGLAAAGEPAPKNEVTKAEHFLKKLEDKAKRMRGQAFKPGYEEKQALERIKALKEKYPDDPAVESLFQRTRAALMESKGDSIEITPDMLAYRQNEGKLKEIFAAEAEAQQKDYLASVHASGRLLDKAFPPPAIDQESPATLKNRYVVLDGFEYPTNEFTEGGQQYLYVGSLTQGFYWVSLGGPSWIGPYEAVKRYRRLVNRDVPEGGKWTVVGRITGVRLLVPQAEKKKTVSPQWGWVVEPEAILVPGLTFAVVDKTTELGGVFAGEERLEQLKSGLYTLKEVAADASPETVVLAYATAIQEKNFELAKSLVWPERLNGPRAMDLFEYHWDWHQHRFRTFYVHVTTDEAKIEVQKGYDQDNAVEDFFLTDEQKAKVSKISEEKVEQATVWSKAWDERGRQYGSPKPHFLRRVGGAKGRWYIVNFEQPY
jgi:hypothetical protein